jgi:L-ribulokinase
MTSLKPRAYRPVAANRRTYEGLYRIYRTLHDSFGGLQRDADLGRVMKDLLAIKEQSKP